MTRRRERPPWCRQCDEETRLVDAGDASPPHRCPRCHAGTQPGGRYAPPAIRPPALSPLELALGDRP